MMSKMTKTIGIVCALTLGIGACVAPSDEDQENNATTAPEVPPLTKEQARTMTSSPHDYSGDICEESGWYGDGECDEFCDQPDVLDCEEPAQLIPYATCPGNHVYVIERPIDVSRPEQGTFAYTFDYRPPASPDLPTIVFLPGGPGQSSIKAKDDSLTPVPAEYGLLRTDPRGVGCNAIERVEDRRAFYDSEVFARDVIAAIAHVGLDDYVIYGHSYGTILATVTAHTIEQQRAVPAPRAVVLEGVLGRAFGDDENPGRGYQEVWAKLGPALPADAQAVLAEESPLGLSPKEWGQLFMAYMPYGFDRTQHPLLATLTLLSEEANAARGIDHAEALDLVREEVRSVNEHTTGGEQLELQRYINCFELTRLTPEDNVDVVLSGGQLVDSPRLGTLCEGVSDSLERAFDVTQYPYSAPTLYVLGDMDPATPRDMGEYHFEHLTSAPRVKLVPRSTGHSPLQYNLFGDDPACATGILRAAATDFDVREAAEACPRPIEIEQADAR